MKKILGVDFGASTTDFVVMKGKKIIFSESVESAGLRKPREKIKEILSEQVSLIAVTGGKNTFSNCFEGVPVKKVSEVEAIGLGGLFLSGEKKALVASLGTGTCIVSASKKCVHCTGTGVSGGTFLGLSEKILKTRNMKKINSLAEKGFLKRIDLSIRDITDRKIGSLPGTATASNFSRPGAKKEDLAIGIANLVAEANASIISLAADKAGQSKIILTGKLLDSGVLRKRVILGLRVLGKKAVLPKDYGVATAVGACVNFF